RELVLGHRHDAERHREVLACEYQVNTWMFFGFCYIYFLNQRVRMGGPQQPRMQHSRKDDIVRELGQAGDLGAAIHPATRLADHPQWRLRTHGFILTAASSMASKICW